MKPAPKHVCNYSILRFLPYPETEEFVNVGVVVQCSSVGLLDSRILKEKHQRIAAFFPELELDGYQQARRAMTDEVSRYQALLSASPSANGKTLFHELVRPREAVLRFGEIRTLMTDEPERAAEELFKRYVERERPQ